jgi:Tfp pilus assembly protein PilN
VSQVNLLPPELRQRAAVRRTTSIVVAAGLGVLTLIGVFYFLQMQRLSGIRADLEEQQATNAQLQTQIQELQAFATLQAELSAKEDLVTSLFVNEVSWSSALLDISRVIPDAAFLTNLTGQIQPTTGGEGATIPTAAGLIGNMSFAGQARESETIATWLVRLEQVDGWVNAWMTNQQETAVRSRIYQFASGLALTLDAATERAREAVT